MENKDKVYTIYVIKQDSVPCYVGLTSMSLKERFRHHCRKIGHGCIMNSIIAEKGKENFSIEPLLTNIRDKKLALKLEESFTETYKEKYKLYNRCIGQKAHLGKKQSTKTIQKKSKPVLCIDLNRIFSSANAAARELNINQGGISKVCTGKAPSYKGYHWKFA